MPKKFGVIGCDIEHSLSPQIHNNFGEICDLAIDYQIFSVSSESEDIYKDFIAFVKDFFKQDDAIGLNVTIPFKTHAYELCDELSDISNATKSVNTICMRDGKLYGDSTDGYGFISDYHNNFEPLKDKNILIFGAGGAVRGILPNIIKEKPKSIFIYNRPKNISKAEAVVQDLTDFDVDLSLFDKNNKSSKYDVLINAATDKFILDKNNCEICEQVVKMGAKFAYDLSYSKSSKDLKLGLTNFCKWAKDKDLKYSDGLGMLVYQASKSFYIWNELELDADDLNITIANLRELPLR